MSKKDAVSIYQDDAFQEVPDFSFGTKAVIRPLPTASASVVTSHVRTLNDLSDRAQQTNSAVTSQTRLPSTQEADHHKVK